MQLAQVLDVFEGMLVASEHPDIVEVTRFGTSGEPWGPNTRATGITGVKVRHQSTATASLFGAVWPGEKPLPIPDTMPPPPQNRAPRLAIFAVQLLEVARPAQFQSWSLVALPDLGPTDQRGTSPFGVSLVCADGTKMLLRVSATGANVGAEPTEEPFPEYRVPEGVKQWHLRVSSSAFQ
jgi:hypothetical protein